jgi:hypothetical protein
MKPERPERSRPGWLVLLMPILLVHVGAALAMLALLPRGFPMGHARFFSNQLLPPLLLALALSSLVVSLLRPRAAAPLLAAFPALWLGVALGTLLTFPDSGGRVQYTALAGALFQAICFALWCRSFPARPRRWIASACAAAAIGFVLPALLRAPSPSTLKSSRSEEPPLEGTLVSDDVATLTPNTSVDVGAARVHLKLKGLALDIEPLLLFQSRSPDGFWTIFSRQLPDQPMLRRAIQRDSSLDVMYEEGRRMRVDASATELRIAASSVLSASVYSHLNSFSTVTLRGHRRLGLAFSPCADSIVEVLHSDYPEGAPARFAYLDQQGVFHVVQATSAEKGPYHTLASGQLRRGEVLGVRLIELGDKPERTLAELRFADWSRQVSTELSPTAGFSVTENSIEFGLARTDPGSAAYLMLSLADTSVGRGWDTVAHSPGRYDNRVSVLTAE